MMKKIFLLSFTVATVFSGFSATAYAESSFSGGIDEYEGTLYGTRNTGDPEYPCKGRTIRVCGRIKYKKSNSYTVNGMTTYTCDKEVFDADGNNIYLGNETVTVPEGLDFAEALHQHVVEVYGMQYAETAPDFDGGGDFNIRN